MDLDSTLKKHGSRLDELEKFAEHIKEKMIGGEEAVGETENKVEPDAPKVEEVVLVEQPADEPTEGEKAAG